MYSQGQVNISNFPYNYFSVFKAFSIAFALFVGKFLIRKRGEYPGLNLKMCTPQGIGAHR